MKKLKVFFIPLLILLWLIIIIMFIDKNSFINEVDNNNRDYEEELMLKESKIESHDEEIISYQEKVKALNLDIEKLKEANKLLEEENSFIEKKNLELDILVDKVNTVSYPDEIELNRLGIYDFTVITDDLFKQFELLPYEGVLGGTMSFGPVYLINHEWVYANFSDGHIQGYGLYKFVINEEKEIFWEFVAGNLY